MADRKDVIQWASDNIAEIVDLPFFSINPKEDLHTLKQICKTIDELNKKTGLGMLRKLGTGTKEFKYRDEIEDLTENACYINFSDQKNGIAEDSFYIGVNVLKYLRTKYKEEALNKVQNIKDYHSWFLSNNMEDLIVHEYGHRIQNHLPTYSVNNIKSLYNKYGYKLTKRASDDYKEFFAELFSLDYHGVALDRELVEFLNKIKVKR